MIYETTTDKWGADVQWYERDSLDAALDELRADVHAAFGDAAAEEVTESDLVALDAVEVERDDTGVYRIIGDSDMWDAVLKYVKILESEPLKGWNGYTRVYTVQDQLGDIRRYFVAE